MKERGNYIDEYKIGEISEFDVRLHLTGETISTGKDWWPSEIIYLNDLDLDLHKTCIALYKGLYFGINLFYDIDHSAANSNLHCLKVSDLFLFCFCFFPNMQVRKAFYFIYLFIFL